MFEKILVGLDGSPLAEHILGSLEPLFLRPSTELLIARVAPVGSEHAPEQEEALRYLEGVERRLEKQGARASAHRLMGADPARELVSFAAKAGVSLIALATHGRTGLRRLALGSVSERIIRTADRPVLLANPWVATVPLEFKRVVLPLDGSERSEETFPIASELARHFGSRLVLVHVEALIPLDPGPLVGREHSVSVRTFERARRALGSAAIETIVKSGAPDEGVLAAISEATPDVVVATTHGRTGLARLACGSVTEALIRRSPVPVIVQRSVPALAARMSTVHHERASTE